MSKCVICKEHVPTGPAFLVLIGEIIGDGSFTARDTEGVMHEECGDPDTQGMLKFPIRLKLP
jgi:hypothetical protein